MRCNLSCAKLVSHYLPDLLRLLSLFYATQVAHCVFTRLVAFCVFCVARQNPLCILCCATNSLCILCYVQTHYFARKLHSMSVHSYNAVLRDAPEFSRITGAQN